MKAGSLLFAVILLSPSCVWPFTGIESASFLDIPVGARPAALGSAYSALGRDAFSSSWNPAGLGFLDSTQLGSMHLAYLESMAYEYVAAAHPIRPGYGLGAAFQYFRPDDFDATDLSGNRLGSDSASFSGYTLAYGQALNPRLSLGLAGKLVKARISDASSSGRSLDLGIYYRAAARLTLAVVGANLAGKARLLGLLRSEWVKTM
ncbi:MAG: PorV/PorQ family protein [Elusimicrobia bacterium]|nr:PorV/PorQ family protein [Elusimicrobiota bacterium]